MAEERRLPKGVVEQDQELEGRVQSASEALAELRWQWTLNEENSERVSFAQYARDVGGHKDTIRTYARGYEIFKGANGATPFALVDAIERAKYSEAHNTVIEAVADAHDTTFHVARRHHKDDVKEVKAAVTDEMDKRTEKGETFPAEDQEDYAKKVAQQKKRSREARESARLERSHTGVFMSVDARLTKARQELKEALVEVRDVEFTDEEVMLLERQNEAVQGMSKLLASALVGDSGTDWDAALADLEERRQNG